MDNVTELERQGEYVEDKECGRGERKRDGREVKEKACEYKQEENN